MNSIPVLQTERLTLRAPRMTDFDSFSEVVGTDHVKYMGGPMGQKDAWKVFCSDLAQWSLLGHGAWSVDLRESGEFVGQVSIIKPPHFPEVEIGWIFFPQAEGKGYAHEAASAALGFAFETLKLKTLVSYIDSKNVRSIALAKRLGALPDTTAEHAYPEDDDIVYRHQAPEAIQ